MGMARLPRKGAVLSGLGGHQIPYGAAATG